MCLRVDNTQNVRGEDMDEDVIREVLGEHLVSELRAIHELVSVVPDMNERLGRVEVELAEVKAIVNVHTDILTGHSATLASHSAILASHSAILASHSAILDQHTATLADHSAILANHGEDLADIKLAVSDLAAASHSH